MDFKGFKAKKRWLLVLAFLLLCPHGLMAMHIAEGFLPVQWCGLWYAATIPFVIIGIYALKKKVARNPRIRILLGIAGGLTFLLSALKLPSVTGSCSNMTGIALGAILFGPFAMSVIGLIVLLFQALLLAHGGITTLGANSFSMAVVGSLVAWTVYTFLNKTTQKPLVAVFVAAFFSDILTYMVTAFQLALAFPGEAGFNIALLKFVTMFAYTQLPLAVIEGIITVGVFKFLMSNTIMELSELGVVITKPQK